MLLSLFKKINCLCFHDQLINTINFLKRIFNSTLCTVLHKGGGPVCSFTLPSQNRQYGAKALPGLPSCLQTVLWLGLCHHCASVEFQPAYNLVPLSVVYHLHTEKNVSYSRGNTTVTIPQLLSIWNHFFMSGSGEVLLALRS